jgi:hypothetical protein
MRVIVEGTTYEWGHKKFLNTESILLKRKLGLTAKEWYQAVVDEDGEAITALVWFVRRRNGEPDLKFEDVVFDLGDAKIENDEDDLSEAPDPTVTATPPASPPAATVLADPVPAALAPAGHVAATAKPSPNSAR